MKRFWLVLLSLGLIMAFSVSAYAVDVKFSGDMFVGGMYMDKVSLDDTPGVDSQSTAFYFQRLRLMSEFIVSPGLSVIARADIMERVWGAARSNPGVYSSGGKSPYDSYAATTAEMENIALDTIYLQYASPVGVFQAGYIPFGGWGTPFGNDNVYVPGMAFYKTIDKLMLGAIYFKVVDQSKTAYNLSSTQTDADLDIYALLGIYTAKNWSAGLLGAYYRSAATRALGYLTEGFAIEPYFIVNIGNVKIQSEITYFGGKDKYETAGVNDVDIKAWTGWVDVSATFGKFYVDGFVAYVSGDDPSDSTEVRTFALTEGGADWSPTLILWNRDRAYWFGNVGSSNAALDKGGNYMSNAWLCQLKGGVKPVDKLDLALAVSYARADQDGDYAVGQTWQSKELGWEIDLTGSYKLTNNLTYMLGVGYLITGDYFKGFDPNADVANDYMVINKLTLTF